MPVRKTSCASHPNSYRALAIACFAGHPLSVVVGVFMKRPNASSSCGWSDLIPASRIRSAALAAIRLVLLARNFWSSGAMAALPIPLRELSLVSVASIERSAMTSIPDAPPGQLDEDILQRGLVDRQFYQLVLRVGLEQVDQVDDGLAGLGGLKRGGFALHFGAGDGGEVFQALNVRRHRGGEGDVGAGLGGGGQTRWGVG